MPQCARCTRTTLSSTMSRFTTEILCLPCATDEREAPGYAAAHAAELAAIRAGDWNFPGAGLSAADRQVLHDRLTARDAHTPPLGTTPRSLAAP